MDIKDMHKEVDDWIGGFEEGYWHPLSMLAQMTEEVGELAREVNHSYGQKPKKSAELEGNIALELADILFVVLCFANSLGIDLETAFKMMMEKYRQRDSERWTPRKNSNKPDAE
ncbi:MAG: nucleotide pyrophosphohydrolase [Firmicutes bacterium HGW-Firmicutes-8]|nr:MAG: nucleotide pyrophosphohydrolase [Firmicutes bacterium HGW-Firmicutes-8]